MWFGFAIPATINSLDALHAFYNFILHIDLSNNILILLKSVNLLCTPRFEIIGLSYLLSLDVSIDVWFFAPIALLQTGFQRMIGWSIGPTQPLSDPAPLSVAHLDLSALFFLVGSSFWHNRIHLKDVFRKAFREVKT